MPRRSHKELVRYFPTYGIPSATIDFTTLEPTTVDEHGLCGLSTRINDAPHSHLCRPTSTFRAFVYAGSTAPSKCIYVFHEQPQEIWRDILSISAKSNRGFPI